MTPDQLTDKIRNSYPLALLMAGCLMLFLDTMCVLITRNRIMPYIGGLLDMPISTAETNVLDILLVAAVSLWMRFEGVIKKKLTASSLR